MPEGRPACRRVYVDRSDPLEYRMTSPSHQGLYRNAPLVLGGLLGSLGLSVAGTVAGLQIDSREQRLPLVLGMLGLFVLIFAVCGVARCAGIAGRSRRMPC